MSWAIRPFIYEVIFRYQWNSRISSHEDLYYCRIHGWRDLDLLPFKIRDNIFGKKSGDVFKLTFNKGELIPYSDKNIISIDKGQFSPVGQFKRITPRLGRFYPIGFFKGLAGVFPQNLRPVRIINIDDNLLKIDANIPIAEYDINFEAEIINVWENTGRYGGECKDWCAISLENGPGMQTRYDNLETDFEIENPMVFKREDESDDKIFYKEPRITAHIDAKCHENLVALYDIILPEGGKILDFMSSYQSHIRKKKNQIIVGLGINEIELQQNEVLDSFLVKDINEDTNLPFMDNEFDAVVCDLSIEYLIKPLDILKEINRILKPGGVFCISFSNRYFPEKVIRLWTGLHEFERIGFVLELLIKSGRFKDFKTYSYRGFPRPYDDKYFGSIFLSDPLYVICCKKEKR